MKKLSLGGHLKNRRFRKNEFSILKIFIANHKKDITAKKIARETKLGRSTFYTHHHAVGQIVPDYEKHILISFSAAIRKRLEQKNSHLKSIYLELLLFIFRNKDIFQMFVKLNDRDVIAKMVNKLDDKIIATTNLPKNSDKILKIYTSEVVEVIFEWGKIDFAENEIEHVLSDIMYLTNTCWLRLSLIMRGYEKLKQE